MKRTILFLIFIVIGVSFSLMLGGCASFDTPFKPEFDRGSKVPIEYLYVDTREEMNIFCGEPKESFVRLGCAFIPTNEKEVCVVFLYNNGSQDIKEHEEKHCRYGRWHP